MIELSLARVAELVGGRVQSGAETMVTAGVETDSRLVEPGSLFVAKPGEVTDGHAFVAAAKAAGAVAAIVERELQDVDLPQVLVAN